MVSTLAVVIGLVCVGAGLYLLCLAVRGAWQNLKRWYREG